MLSGRRYLVELGLGILVYIALLIVSLHLFRHQLVPPSWRVPVSLVPMLGGLLTIWAILRQFRRMDEMQRKCQFDAIGLAFLGTALITFSYGFLENVGFPRLSMFMVWPIMASLWVVGSVAAAWRYRA